jgi:hypothetical protein
MAQNRFGFALSFVKLLITNFIWAKSAKAGANRWTNSFRTGTSSFAQYHQSERNHTWRKTGIDG